MNVGFIFGIIMAIIVMGFLMFFAVKYIGETTQIACESQMGQQINNLEKSVKTTFSLSQGSSQKMRLIIPKCFEKVCFIDSSHPDDYPEGGWEPENHVRIFVTNENYNVVFFRPSGVVEGYKISKLRPYVNFCMDSSKEVTLRNIGSLVEITLPEF